jgi:hypothetical protein
MAWISGGLCGDRVVEWVVETRYIFYLRIGVKYASNFGNPERFAKGKKPQTLVILSGLPKENTSNV